MSANSIRPELCRLRRQIAEGNDSELWIWVIEDQLACAQRPLRDDPIYGGRRPLPEKAQPLVEAWVERVVASGFRSIISLLEAAQIERYYARGGMNLHKNGLIGFYESSGLRAKGGLLVSADDELKDTLKRTLEQLTPREREVLKQRFGIEVGADVTLAEVAKQFDITRDKIREIERRAREKLGNGDDPEGSA